MLEVMPRSKLFCLQDKFRHYRKKFRTIDRPVLYSRYKKIVEFRQIDWQVQSSIIDAQYDQNLLNWRTKRYRLRK